MDAAEEENADAEIARVCKDYFNGRPMLQMKTLLKVLQNAYQGGQGKSLEMLHKGTIGCKLMQMPVQYQFAFIKNMEMLKISQEDPSSSHKFRAATMIGTAKNDNDVSEIPGIDVWYEGLAMLSSCQPENFFRFYNHGVDNPGIKIFEHCNAIVAEGTTGLMTWEASIQFSKWLQSTRPSEFERTEWVMELGAGTGLLGITALKTFPNIKKYVATDGSESAILSCQRNFNVNLRYEKGFSDGRAEFEELDWVQNVEKFKTIIKRRCKEMINRTDQILIGADIVFDSTLIPSLVNLINIFLDADDGVCFLSCPVRNESTLAVFLKELENDRKVQEVHEWKSAEGGKGLIYRIS